MSTSATIVRFAGRSYAATSICRGAAYELFAETRDDGFLPNPRPGAQYPFRRFVHSTDVLADQPPVTEPIERPMRVAVGAAGTPATLQRLSQIPPGRLSAGEAALIARVRRSAVLTTGTTMIKILTAGQVAGYLGGWPLAGFCHREYDLAHLRTPADLAPFGGPAMGAEVVYALRWRAIDPADYQIPFATGIPARLPTDRQPAGRADQADARQETATTDEADATGLTEMPATNRFGPPVLGTGFAMADRHLVPEWITADLADLPMPMGTSLTAYTSDGTEVILYTYQPERHAWLRMCGRQWWHLLGALGSGISAGQEYVPVPETTPRLVGYRDGAVQEAVADPPNDFRAVVRQRAMRMDLDAVRRRTRYARWRDELCTVVQADQHWRRVRLCHPAPDQVQRLAATALDRGLYESWAPASEIVDEQDIEFEYRMPGSRAVADRP